MVTDPEFSAMTTVIHANDIRKYVQEIQQDNRVTEDLHYRIDTFVLYFAALYFNVDTDNKTANEQLNDLVIKWFSTQTVDSAIIALSSVDFLKHSLTEVFTQL
jgi:hypothetical protein